MTHVILRFSLEIRFSSGNTIDRLVIMIKGHDAGRFNNSKRF